MDIIKSYIYLDLGICGLRIPPTLKNKYSTQSRTWVQWLTVISPGTCAYCADMQGHILCKDDPSVEWPPVHENCHCQILPVTAFPAGTATEDGLSGVDYYLFTRHCLPENYMTQDEAKLRGWKRWLGNLWDVLPGVIIGGDQYYNWDGRLPQALGRIWYEADFDYNGGYRNWKRIVFSNDGLMFVTYDHYLTFLRCIGRITMMTFTIDLTTVHSYYDLHEHLKEVFSFPDWYGRNMDALWDMLHCAFDEPVTIEVKGANSVRKDLKDVVQRMLNLLAELERRDGVLISYSET